MNGEQEPGRRVTVAHRCPTCGEHFPASYRICPKDGTTLDRAIHRRSQEDPLMGAILAGTYRVVRPVTMGGMGRIYRAEHTRLRTPVVVKVIHPNFSERPAEQATARQRLEREADALLEVQSPHVLRLLDRCQTDDGRLALVLEWLDGEDLAVSLRREGTFSNQRAVAVGVQLASALAAAHKAGVLHRDIKPSNVFLERTHQRGDWVKLLDFGVAKLSSQDDITREGALLGTPSYMAPEQATGASVADERSDVYGLCAVLFHMLTGQGPVPEGDPESQLMWLRRGTPVAPVRQTHGDVPAALAAIVDQGLHRDPAQRPPSARAVEEALLELEGERRLRRLQGPGVIGSSARNQDEAPRTRSGSRGAGGPGGSFYLVAFPPLSALWAAALLRGLGAGMGATQAIAGVALLGVGSWLWRRHWNPRQGQRLSPERRRRLASATKTTGWAWAAFTLAVTAYANLTGLVLGHDLLGPWPALLVGLVFLFSFWLSPRGFASDPKRSMQPQRQRERGRTGYKATAPQTASTL